MLLECISFFFVLGWASHKHTLREGFVCSDFFFFFFKRQLAQEKQEMVHDREGAREDVVSGGAQPQADPVRRLWSIKYTHLRVCLPPEGRELAFTLCNSD